MASRARLRPLSGGTDVSLADLLNRLDNNPADPYALREFEEIFDDVQGDEGFRSASTSLQSRQDRHLKRFITVMRLKSFRDPSATDIPDDEVIKREIRDATKEQVITNLRLYLRAEVRLMRPRGTSDERPRYQSLLQCRESMIFWIQREMGHENAPYRWVLINASNETLQRLGRQLGLNRNRRVKTYFGRLELAQLIDYDTLQSLCLAVTESHHLAWCLGCVCGVRPGSIGWTRHHKDQYLTFGDIEITRGYNAGEFNCKINFRFLKGNRDNLEIETGLKFSVNGATTSALLPMSIPHRLLVMLLRREGLRDHDSLDSLLSGTDRFIVIKEDMHAKPVCRAGGPRGLSVTEEALGADSMSQFLQQHARAAGYSSTITMYAWRRKAGTQWLRTEGLDKAKQLMGHDHRSDSLRRYYDQGLFDVPVFELAMRTDTAMGAATLDEDSSAVLMRMVDGRRVKGAFLAKRVKEILQDDEEYVAAMEAGNIRVVNNMKRRATRLAERALYDEQKQLHDTSMTVEEFERRKAALADPTSLVQLIREKARSELRSKKAGKAPHTETEPEVAIATTSAAPGANKDPGARPAGQPPGRAIGYGAGQATTGDIEPAPTLPQPPRNTEDDTAFSTGLEDRDLAAEDLQDAEDDFIAVDQGEEGIQVDVDANAEYADEDMDSQDSFAIAVQAFMVTLGKAAFVDREAGHDLICELCAASPYTNEEAKTKIWSSKAKLLNHQLAREHSKHGEIMKRLHFKAMNAEDGKYRCPYGRCEAKFTNINKLTEHIRGFRPPFADNDVEALDFALQHDNDKRADGWYDDDFETSMSERKPHVVREFRRRSHGLRYSSMEELPEPVKVSVNTSYNWVLGDPEGARPKDIAEKYKNVVALGSDLDAPDLEHPWKEVPAQYQGIIALGNDSSLPPFQHPLLKDQYHETYGAGLVDGECEEGDFQHPMPVAE